jgi:tRNA/rRNA methyltransferase
MILVEPQLDQNIGKTARAMLNFGLKHLRLVSPKADWLSRSARVLCAGADEVLEKAQVYETFEEAVADIHYLYGTTARPRELIKEVVTPEEAVLEGKTFKAQGHKVGFLFGPERTGLENHHVARCHKVLTIPLNPEFSSLNLAQAVVVVAYEWFQKNHKASVSSPMLPPEGLACREEVEGLIGHMDEELLKAGYYRTDHKRPLMYQSLLNLFSRIPLTSQEVRTLRGVISTLVNPHGINSRMTKRRAQQTTDPKAS